MNFVLPQKKVCKESSRLHFSATRYGLLTKIGKLATLKQRQFLRSLSLWGPGCEINAGKLLTRAAKFPVCPALRETSLAFLYLTFYPSLTTLFLTCLRRLSADGVHFFWMSKRNRTKEKTPRNPT
jgi:hypothetical protein